MNGRVCPAQGCNYITDGFLCRNLCNSNRKRISLVSLGTTTAMMFPTFFYLLLPLALAVPFPLPAKPSLPTRTIAGVPVPDTPLIRAAESYMKSVSPPVLYGHVMRSWLFNTLMISHNATLSRLIDPEVQAIAILLHDLGFDRNPQSRIVSPDRRFEVDGAIAARDFLTSHKDARGWDKHRVQLVWDAIALHTEAKYALFKEPDVQAVAKGIMLDFEGPGRGVTEQEYAAVVKEFPQEGLRENVGDTFAWLCRTKPVSTYGEFFFFIFFFLKKYTLFASSLGLDPKCADNGTDTFMQPFGERFVPGYSAVGGRTIDFVLGPAASV